MKVNIFVIIAINFIANLRFPKSESIWMVLGMIYNTSSTDSWDFDALCFLNLLLLLSWYFYLRSSYGYIPDRQIFYYGPELLRCLRVKDGMLCSDKPASYASDVFAYGYPRIMSSCYNLLIIHFHTTFYFMVFIFLLSLIWP